MRYLTMLRWLKSKGELSELDTLLNTGMLFWLIVEVSLAVLAPYPFLAGEKVHENYPDFNVTIVNEVNDYLLLFSFLRVYLFIRTLLVLSSYMGPRSQRICSMNGSNASYEFAVRCLMQARPYHVLVISLIVSIAAFGFCIRVFERPLSATTGQNFNSYANSFWVTIVTMTTVGYGDFFPKSHAGRVVGIIISMWGVFFVSLFVVTLTNILNFEGSEEKAYQLLQRLAAKEDLRVEAVNVLTRAYRQRMVAMKAPNNKSKLLGAVRDFRKYMMRFEKIAR